MHKYLALCLVIFSVTFSGCAKDKKKSAEGPAPVRDLNVNEFPNIAGTVYGRWLNDKVDTDKEFKFYMKLFTNRTQVGIEVECDRFGQRVGSSFSVNAVIDTANVQILEDGTKTTKSPDGRMSCTAKISRGKFGYYVFNDRLILTNPKGEINNMSFTRIQ